MGSSPSATLFYGVIPSSTDECDLSRPWALALPDFDGDEYDAESALAAILGWKEVAYADEKTDPANYAVWLANLKEQWALKEACPIEFLAQGYEGQDGSAIVIKASVTSQLDWGTRPIDKGAMFPGPTWKAELERWREILKIPAEQWGEPSWYLMADYG